MEARRQEEEDARLRAEEEAIRRRMAEERERARKEKEEIAQRNALITLQCSFPNLPPRLIQQELASRNWNVQVIQELADFSSPS